MKRQNEVTEAYLAALPERAWFAARCARCWTDRGPGVPLRRAGRYVVSRNDGTQNQDVLYVADSLDELRAGGRVLVDPNRFSADGTSALSSLHRRPASGYAAFGAQRRPAATGRPSTCSTWPPGAPIADPAITTKFSSAEWLPDGQSYVYLHFDHDGDAEGTQATALAGAAAAAASDRRPIEADDRRSWRSPRTTSCSSGLR